MPDMLKMSKEEEQRKRDEAQLYSMQQQIDELRRQLKESMARQQWFEELSRQNEGKVQQLQMSQDRLSQDVVQHLSAREIGEGRMKARLDDIATRVDAPDKQLRELRAQIIEVNKIIKGERDVETADRQQIDEIQRQIRDIHAAMGVLSDGQRQLRDLIHELDAAIGEVKQEAVHVAEMQRLEEQRLRRSGVELQEAFEALRQQFTEIAAKTQRVDDVRRQLVERIEAVEELLTTLRTDDDSLRKEIERMDKTEMEHYLSQQDRVETIRIQVEASLGEMRQVADQRLDRYTNRFLTVDERLRNIEQLLSEIPPRFEALERRDETIGAEADSIEEWLVMKQLAAMESVLEEVRKRRAERSPILRARSTDTRPATGSAYYPAGLLKSVKDARPPIRKENQPTDGDTDE